MKKIIFYLTLIFVIEINYGQKSDYDSDRKKCIEANKDQCTSISINSKGYECCRQTEEVYNQTYLGREVKQHIIIDQCALYYTQFVSQSMMKFMEVLTIEEMGIEGLSNYTMRSRFDITCNSASSYYDIGNYNYTPKDLQILNSPNHCLYYYYNSMGRKRFSQNKTSITKDVCFNAESLDITKKENIYCSYYEYTITFDDKSMTEFKTCNFLSSEYFKYGRIGNEESIDEIIYAEQNKTGKLVTNYEVKVSNKNGETIHYNLNGDTANNFFYSVNFSKILLFGLFLLI